MTSQLILDNHAIVGDEPLLSNPVDGYGYNKIRCDRKGQPEEKTGEKSTAGCNCLHIRSPPGAPVFNQAFA